MAARPERIVLVGLPGSGKSTVGPLLARRLGWRFVDLDQQIEAETGLAVADIFARRGELEFRHMEAELTARLGSETGLVLAPGGGWIVHQNLPDSFIVWLQVDPSEAIMRLGEGATVRPLLQPNPVARMKQLLAEREPYYERADSAIDTNGMSPDAIAIAIEEEYGNQEEK
ncbi:MAG: shikimate kinase [Gemmatimonadota bacterium]